MSEVIDQHGVPIVARNPECIDLFNQCVRELVGWVGDPYETAAKSVEKDSSFVLGHILSGLNKPKEFLKNYETLKYSAKAFREKKHLEAMHYLTNGRFRDATYTWEQILIEYPTDMLAIKLANECYITLGDTNSLRDSPARVFELWKENYSSLPTYGSLMGIYAYGLEESNFYMEAERLGRHAVELVPHDAWAVHSVAHVLEMECRYKEGINWLEETHRNWKDSIYMSVHNNWHNALYHLELEHFEEALGIFDKYVHRDKSIMKPLDLIDASSLLLRCEMQGVDVGNRWDELIESWESHKNEHQVAFMSIHMMMNAVRCSKPQIADKILGTMKSYSTAFENDPTVTQSYVHRSVGIPVANALRSWGLHEYAEAADNIMRHKHEIPSLGGSHAQRDIFNLLLIRSSMKSNNFKMAQNLLLERLEQKPKSPQTWKMYKETLNGLCLYDKANQVETKYRSLLG